MAESAPSYNIVVRDHFESPRNTPCHTAGPGTVFASAGDPAAGTRVRLSARVRGDRLAEMRFEVFGCPHAIAAASVLTEQLAGATVQDASCWSWRPVARMLEVPPEKRGRLLILEDALRSLIDAARGSQQGP